MKQTQEQKYSFIYLLEESVSFLNSESATIYIGAYIHVHKNWTFPYFDEIKLESENSIIINLQALVLNAYAHIFDQKT